MKIKMPAVLALAICCWPGRRALPGLKVRTQL